MRELMLMCSIAGRRAAIPASAIRSVIEIEDVTPIPGTPPHIAGLTALRSQALTVIDCRVALGFAPLEQVVGARAAVVEHEGHPYALLVDEAHDVGEALSEPREVPGGFGEGWRHAAKGLIETAGGPALTIAIDRIIETENAGSDATGLAA